MKLTRRGMIGAAAAVPLSAKRSRAADRPVIRIGVLNDMSGPFRDLSGMTSVACAKQAAAEFGNGAFDVDVVFADHQNKPDIGAAIARRWYDEEGVTAVLDIPTSSVALAVSSLAREKNKIFVASGAASPDLTGKQCSPNTIQWTLDAYMLAKTVGGAIARGGGKSWYFITVDYVFGHQLERDARRFVTEAGGTVIGSSPYPLGNADFSSYLVKAQSSGADVLALACSGNDMINCVKQAHEFGLMNTMQLAALSVFITDVHSLGLAQAEGLKLTETFYWDLNDRTRAFAGRVRPRTPDSMPNMVQAGCYSSTVHLLKAAADIGYREAKSDGRALVDRMKAMPVNDDAFGSGSIRVDGRTLFPAYLFQVKSPKESSGPWDCYKLLQTIPSEQAWRPLNEGGCELAPS